MQMSIPFRINAINRHCDVHVQACTIHYKHVQSRIMYIVYYHYYVYCIVYVVHRSGKKKNVPCRCFLESCGAGVVVLGWVVW